MTKDYIVKGVLAKVLRISRVFGMAPLTFKKQQDGYKITASFYCAIYSYVIIAIINTITAVGICLDLKARWLGEKSSPELSYIMSDLITASICSGYGGYNGFQRMNQLTTSMIRLEKVRHELDYEFEKKNIKYRDYINLAVIIMYGVASISFSTLQINHLLANDASEVKVVVCFVLYIIVSMNMNLLEAQAVCVLREIQRVLEAVNYELDQLASVDIAGNDYIRFMETKNLQHLASVYITTVDVLSKMNLAYGFVLFILFTNFILILIASLFYLIILIKDIPILIQAYYISWSFLYLLVVIVFIELCNNINSEVGTTKIHLNSIIQKCTSIGQKVPNEVELLFKQFTLNMPKYSPMGVFSPQRSSFITILSAVITYVLFMMQLKS